MEELKIYSEEKPSDEFSLAFLNSGSIYAECECGRVFYTTFDGEGIFDEGELEAIREKEKKYPDKVFDFSEYSSVGIIHINGEQYVDGCPCNGLTRFENFIWGCRWGISSYFRKKAEEAQKDADNLKSIAQNTTSAIKENQS